MCLDVFEFIDNETLRLLRMNDKSIPLVYCINKFRPAEGTKIYKGKDIQTNNSEEETRLDGLHPLANGEY